MISLIFILLLAFSLFTESLEEKELIEETHENSYPDTTFKEQPRSNGYFDFPEPEKIPIEGLDG